MNDFVFNSAPWEDYLSGLNDGCMVPAAQLLTILEGESDETVEEAFALAAEKHLILDISTLPKNILSGQSAVRLNLEEKLVKEGLKPQGLEETDPLRLYLEELASIPAFGDDEEILAEDFLNGSDSAASALASLGLGRVVALAQEYTGYGVLLMDLIQEGSLGLWQAIQEYSGGDYSSYRDYAISTALKKTVILQARNSGLGQKLRSSMQDYRSVDERLLGELGRNPTMEDIAEQLHMTPEDTATVKKMLDDAFLLNQTYKETEPEETEAEEEAAVEDTAYFQMRQRIEELLSQLSDTDARILTMRFGLEKGRPMTPEETSRKLGMTINEITAREAAALAKLRNFS